MPEIALIYSRFGPYHMARLRGAQSAFASKGWEVFGIEVCPDDKFYPWDKVADASGVRRIPLFPGRAYSELSRAAIRDAVGRSLDAERPDAVACPGWFFAEALAGAAWCRRNGAMAVLMSESGRMDSRRIWWREWMKRRSVRRFDAALVGGRAHADYLAELGMALQRIVTGHNVVDNTWFARGAAEACQHGGRVRQALGLPERYLLASGRFVGVKNFARLLQAYRRYREAGVERPLPLVLVGDGPLRPELQALAESLGLAPHVHWPGFLQYDSLAAYYGLAEAFILPSVSEPWGLVVNEAMASGLPVLVSDRAGCRYELVEPGRNGFLFDPEQVRDMAEAMARISALPDLQRRALGQRSREIIAQWGPERFGEGLWEALQAAKVKGDSRCVG